MSSTPNEDNDQLPWPHPAGAEDSALPGPAARGSVHMEAEERRVPEGNGSQQAIEQTDARRPDPFYPFPLGEGTGERVVSAFGAGAREPFPHVGNGSERGTAPAGLPHRGARRSLGIQPALSPDDLASAKRERLLNPTGGRSSWIPIPAAGLVADLLAGRSSAPRPSVGRLPDGTHWLYAACTNGLAGESGAGKSWTALAGVVLPEVNDDHAVVYVDFEDNPASIYGRLLTLGADPTLIADESRFAYVHPEEAFKDDVRAGFWNLLDTMQPTVVVIDSTGESMALEGTDPNSDDAVASWFQRVATAIARRGPAVLLLDHLPKSDNTAGSPIGSQRKKAAISGAQFIQTVKSGMSFAKGRAGEATITVTKDRHGHFVTGDAALRLIVNPNPSRGEGGLDAILTRAGSEDWAPTRQMSDISEFIQKAGQAVTTSAIKKGVTGKTETLIKALAVLKESGYISEAPGARNAREYTHVKPFRIGDTYSVPDGVVEEDSGPSCDHEWHAGGRCNPNWCHGGHHGSCNN